MEGDIRETTSGGEAEMGATWGERPGGVSAFGSNIEPGSPGLGTGVFIAPESPIETEDDVPARSSDEKGPNSLSA